MMSVTLTRDLRPRTNGETIIVPDDVATKLVSEGSAKDARLWPEGSKPDKATITQRITTGTLKLAGKLTRKGLPQ